MTARTVLTGVILLLAGGNAVAQVTVNGSVYGGGKGEADDETVAYVTRNTVVNMSGGTVSKSVYGGGQLAQVGGNTKITVSGATIITKFI